MSIIDDYRRRLAEIATQATVVLSVIADAEERLNGLKNDVKEVYERLDEALDGKVIDVGSGCKIPIPEFGKNAYKRNKAECDSCGDDNDYR